MWEALDNWPREQVLQAIIKWTNKVKWYAKEGKNYIQWDSDTIANWYWASTNKIRIEIYMPTEKMTNKSRPFIKFISPNNVQVFITAKDEEMEQFKKIERIISSIAIWDRPESLLEYIILETKNE